jgi:hypothetical protein
VAHVHSACVAYGHAGTRPTSTRCAAHVRGANGGGQAPTSMKLPAGHGGGEDSSPELLVNGEGKESGSVAAFFSNEVGLRWPAVVL